MEFIFFTSGDSRKASTWSNVPFLMASSLESKGHILHRINIGPNRIVQKIINKLCPIILRWEKGYDYIRTPLYRFFTKLQIKRAVRKYNKSDYCIFLTFSFYNKYNSIPSFLFSDWSYQMWIEERVGRKLTLRDSMFIKEENEAINNSAVVLPLFSETVHKFTKVFPNANIRKININVINNMATKVSQEFSIEKIEKKYKSNYILFIGRAVTYRKGLNILIEAVKSLGMNIRIEVIGMSNRSNNKESFVTYNGFLHKEISKECHLYYELLNNAKCIVNTTPIWAAYSSIVEGMYNYNPVIVYPFDQFVEEFGKKIDFGFYADNEESLRKSILKLFRLPFYQYLEMAKNAHDKVKDYTWDRYSDEIIKLINQKNGYSLSE